MPAELYNKKVTGHLQPRVLEVWILTWLGLLCIDRRGQNRLIKLQDGVPVFKCPLLPSFFSLSSSLTSVLQ